MVNNVTCTKNANQTICEYLGDAMSSVRIPLAFHLSFSLLIMVFCASVLIVLWHKARTTSPYGSIANDHIEGGVDNEFDN